MTNRDSKEDYINTDMTGVLMRQFHQLVHMAEEQEGLNKGPRTLIAIKSAGQWLRIWVWQDLLYLHGFKWSVGSGKEHIREW
jgi:hypothetical protein